MDDFVLTAEPFLGGYARDFGGTSLAEVTDLPIMSVAWPLDGQAALAGAVKSVLGVDLPAPGRSEHGAGGQLLGMGPDQYLALLQPGSSVSATIAALAGPAYCTDQSDNWVALRLDGPLARAALERICPIDTDPARFATGSVARTMMEHLGVILISEGPGRFLLLSASSSAASFLHAAEVSLENVA